MDQIQEFEKYRCMLNPPTQDVPKQMCEKTKTSMIGVIPEVHIKVIIKVVQRQAIKSINI